MKSNCHSKKLGCENDNLIAYSMLSAVAKSHYQLQEWIEIGIALPVDYIYFDFDFKTSCCANPLHVTD
jgi:hypothetical protein